MTNREVADGFINGIIIIGILFFLIAILPDIIETIEKRFSKPVKFCPKCGCPTEPIWITEYTKFNTNTGKGTRKERELWYCSNHTSHYRFKSRKTQLITVESDCSKDSKPEQDVRDCA